MKFKVGDRVQITHRINYGRYIENPRIGVITAIPLLPELSYVVKIAGVHFAAKENWLRYVDSGLKRLADLAEEKETT